MRNNTSSKPHILIVDDDATMRLLMIDALPDDSYDIKEFDNGVDVLEHLKHHQADMILLDVNMPGMSGFEVCTEILKLPGSSDISIVMVTALEDAASIAKSYDLGATDFINKPINWDTLPYRIQYLIKARNAIVEIKHHKLHLEYMERISRLITQNKSKDIVMQEMMLAILHIYSADRAMLIKPDLYINGCYVIDCEATSANVQASSDINTQLFNILDESILDRAANSERPILSHYNHSHLPPDTNSTLQQQMISVLNMEHTKNWYLIIQQNSAQQNWTPSDEETFYNISIRITTMLSRYLLMEKLRRNEDLLKQAQKIGQLGNWSWDGISGQLTWSDEVYRIYKHQRHNYTPDVSEYFKINFDEDNNRLNLFKDIQNKISQTYQITHRIRTADNSTRWVHEQCIAVYDKAGALLEINGIVQDITESHNKKEQEVHKNKMDAIGQLTSGVAHDFGNFMTVARGNLELLGESLSKQEAINDDDMELLDDAYSAVNDSVELTRQLLAFSRKKSIDPLYVNIKQTINEFQNLFRNTLGDTISLSIDIDIDLFDILVDPSQFESTLLNLIINARNAMPDGGSLEIKAELRTTEYSQELIRNEDHELDVRCICISIKDSGIGMNAEVLKHAIEPFYTTRINQGTGLGLSMVYGFIKQSRGELLIRSEPDKGTTVYMQFPIYYGKAAEQARTNPANTLNNIQATILIVEDRYAVRKFAARCIRNPGITVLEADNASTAQQLLNTHDVDLLFTDIVMPGDLDGYALANWASQKYSDLKILLTTAIDNENVINEEQRQEENKHHFQLLQKPYSKSELTEKISSFLIGR